MKPILSIFLSAGLLLVSEASWHWPFSESKPEPPRLSVLVRKASDLISEASDLAADGKVSEAVAKYRQALVELDRVERANPELAKSASFGTLRTKRAIVEAAIDSLLLNQVRANAKPVAVSDTTALEKKLALERKPSQTNEVRGVTSHSVRDVTSRPVRKNAGGTVRKAPARALTPREEVMKAIAESDFAKAGRLIDVLLEEKPNDAAALNLKAAKETAEGRYAEAEKTLDRAIRSNSRDYFAYYNMAVLKLQTRADDKDGARRYYETGRTLGGPKDSEIEEMLK